MEQEDTLTKVIELFKKFPGIGQRQAQRFAQFITQSDTAYIQELAESITALHAASRQCPQCFIRHQQKNKLCRICAQGNTETLIVVEKDVDALTLALSAGNIIQAYYFVLGGLIPIANNNQTQVRLPQLITSVQTHGPSEIIIALSVHPDADHTARYLSNTLKKQFPDITVTVLGRGLSSGSELEYSDPETLVNAITHRNPSNPKNSQK